ncbi:transporter substrate-binding domain-containing protein [Cupriavidus oxalaticus]|uniref:transporter substrate-binding domain-containing protein n=1 Tax=Cupriavidus oxalaticus TaxID=96344 RepID=UPI0040332622
MPHTDLIANALAPTGKLRASINLGNPLLAGRHAHDGSLCGVSIDLSMELARRLGLEVSFLAFDAAAKSVNAVKAEEADIGFFAIDPARSEGIEFTAPYVLIEGSYLVRDASPLSNIEEVDRSGHRVVVGAGSAYDLFLTRHLQAAKIERAPTSPAVVDTFLQTGADVAAGVKQQLEADAVRIPGLRLLASSFMSIQQAMGSPAGRASEVHRYLAGFIEDVKAIGLIRDALVKHGIVGAAVAPALSAG